MRPSAFRGIKPVIAMLVITSSLSPIATKEGDDCGVPATNFWRMILPLSQALGASHVVILGPDSAEEDPLLELVAALTAAGAGVFVSSVPTTTMTSNSSSSSSSSSSSHSVLATERALEDVSGQSLVVVRDPDKAAGQVDATRRGRLFCRHKWLFLRHPGALVSERHLRLCSRVHYLRCDQDGNGTIVADIYGINGTRRREQDLLRVDTAGETEIRLELLADPFIWSRRSNLTGVTLLNCVLEWSTILISRAAGAGDDGGGSPPPLPYVGLSADIVEIMMQTMNFSVEWTSPPDGRWGSQQGQSGSLPRWDGIVGELARGRADISTAGLTAAADRMEVVDFADGFLADTVTLNRRIHGEGEEENEVIELWSFVDVFAPLTWLWLLCMAAAMSAALFLTYGGGGGGVLQRLVEDAATVGKHLIQRSSLDSGGGGGEDAEFGLSSKICVLTTAVYGMLLLACYTSTLTSVATVRHRAEPIRSLRDAIAADLPIFVIPGSIDHEFLKGAPPGSVLHDFYRHVLDRGSLADDPYSHMREDPRGMFFGSASLSFALPDVRALKLSDSVGTQLAFAFPKDSEFKELFDFQTKMLRSGGLLDKLKTRWIRGDQSWRDGGGGGYEAAASPASIPSLGYRNLLFPFMVVSVGVCAALVSLVLEVCRRKNAVTTVSNISWG